MIKEKAVTFRNGSGQNLAGIVHFPHRESTPPLLIMAHGFNCDKVGDNRQFVRFARLARNKGFAVLRFDFTGCGESEGEFNDMTVTRQIEDLVIAVEFALSIPCLEESPVYLIGSGLGGAVALSAAAGDPRVRGVVCWSPVSDLQAAFASVPDRESFTAAKWSGAVASMNDAPRFSLRSPFFHDLYKHQPVREIAKLSPRPVLLIQGETDTTVLPEQTEALYQAAGDPKELHVIREAPHSFAGHDQELFSATLKRLDEWSRDVWYAADFPDCSAPAGFPRLSGRA